MRIIAGCNKCHCTCMADLVCVGVDASMKMRRGAQHEHPQKRCSNESGREPTRRAATFHRRELLTVCWSLQLFFRKSRCRFSRFSRFVSPQRKRVSEDDVPKDAAQVVVAEINCGIELKIRCDVARETDS